MGGMTDNECQLLMALVKQTNAAVNSLRAEFGDFRTENAKAHAEIWKVLDQLPCRNMKSCPNAPANGAGGFWKALGKYFRLPS